MLVGPAQMEAIMAALYDASTCHDHHRGAPHVAGQYRRLWNRLSYRLAADPWPRPATLAEAAQSVPGPALDDAVQALTAEDKTWLAWWLADTCPEVAMAGLAAAGRHRAQVRARRRIRGNRRRARQRYWKKRFAA